MATILERKSSERIETEYEALDCQNGCGCGFSLPNSYGKIDGDSCDHCGGALRPRTMVALSRIPGYIMIRCDCGARVTCDAFSNTCDRCGTEYNRYGQAMVQTSWGEKF